MDTTKTARVGNGKGRFRAYIVLASPDGIIEGGRYYAGSSATYANADKKARRLAGKRRGSTPLVEDTEK